MLFDVMEATGWSFNVVKEKVFFTYVLILCITHGPEKFNREKSKIPPNSKIPSLLTLLEKGKCIIIGFLGKHNQHSYKKSCGYFADASSEVLRIISKGT